MQICWELFSAKLLTDKQTNKQRQLHFLIGGGKYPTSTTP